METENKPRRNFVTSRLPWVIGLVALAVYLLTLNHWISLANIAPVAKLTGFSWQGEAYNPVYFVVSAPLQLLPKALIPLAANLLAVLCGTLTLVLLARAVALLPHDRTHQQRERVGGESALLRVPLAWLPPVLATAVCGLQLSFWQFTTSGTPEILNLLLFAYAVRALLEFRVDGKELWLMKAAIAYGALMTSDWLAVGAFPAFVIALIWLQKMRFFNLGFLARVGFCGVLGLSLYFVLPLVAAVTKADGVGFWETLKLNLGMEKTMIMMFPKKTLLLMFLTSAVPTLLIAFKWASYFGDTSRLGVTAAHSIFHVVHAAFLFACLWVLFDPKFSPRNSGLGFPFLPLNFLTALCVGYFSGYFLLVFRPLRRNKRIVSGNNFLNALAAGVVILLAIAAPAALVFKNLPVMTVNNRPAMTDCLRLSAESLPKNGFLLADDPRRALLMQQWLTQLGREKDIVVVETWSLTAPVYHRHLKKQYGERWPFTAEEITPQQTVQLNTLEVVKRLVKTGEVYYLHPSFGVFFEYFYPEPHGLVYRLQPFSPGRLLPPALRAEVIAENNAFWQKTALDLFPKITAPIASLQPGHVPTLRQKLIKKLHVEEDPFAEARNAGAYLSRALNYWAVEARRAGDRKQAMEYFEQALALNPDNVVARANLDFNRAYNPEAPKPVTMLASVEDRFGPQYTSWDQVLGANGPYDEPDLSYAYGFSLVQHGLVRQAALSFQSVRSFVPDDLASQLWLAQLHLAARQPDVTFELAKEVLDRPQRFNASETNRVDALALVARAEIQRQKPDAAVALLETAVKAAPANAYLLANVTAIYSESGRYSNALTNVKRQLQLAPNDPFALLNKGFCEIQLEDYPNAIVTTTTLLTLSSNNPNALLNRAIAYLRNDQLELARKDYETLKELYPTARQIYYGLGEVAYRRHETNAAIEHYTAYLANATPDNAESKFVQGRLQELRGESASKP